MRYPICLEGTKKLSNLGHGLVGRVSSGCPVKVRNSDGRVALYPNLVRRIRPLLGAVIAMSAPIASAVVVA
ncbi:hypothetical protein AXF42_Ash018448 [Apostasia shenzhenica]|uniref:Uncharacterized protein n=1 Tax=Apostasia shenzhenica TaxID=1088818 RepID=A0A2I0BEF0_9ASPA|nr:hypothetical protein AXF42_Ash018448 [Apostasia shenzhenica]